MTRNEVRQVICDVFNKIKRVDMFNLDNVAEDAYLGGDLGFDSIEMLEAWVDIQKGLNIVIQDSEMIDILTIGEVIDLILTKNPKKADS